LAAQFDRFEAYGFGIDYPSEWAIEFDHKSVRNSGGLGLRSPTGYKVFLSWGDLEKVKKLGGTEAHADFSVERVKGNKGARIIDGVKGSMMAGGHRASFRDVRFETSGGGVIGGSKTVQEIRSLHAHCDVSSRYFVLYGQVGPENAEEQGKVVSAMIKGFACHRVDPPG
jgi:hypothetical protein